MKKDQKKHVGVQSGEETIHRQKLTEAAKPGEDRRERDEEGVVSVKPPCSP
jgi:hypothetical protein